jgi:hypothetical protein
MNTESLLPLSSRWPNDQVITKIQPDLSDESKMLSTPRGESIYQDALRIDPADSSVIRQFAAANNMTYAATATTFSFDGVTVPAWLGRRMNTTMPMFAHEVSGMIFGYKVTFCVTYEASSRQGGLDSTTSDPALHQIMMDKKSVIRVELPKVFPQLVLDSNVNDAGSVSTIPTAIKASEKLPLEGDFAQYFDFYAPAGLQVDALTVLAPNFMEILKSSAASFDVEFYGDQMILLTREPIYTPQAMQSAVDVLKLQLGYLDTLLQSWDYLPTVQPFDRLDYSLVNGGGVLKIGGIRLKPAAQILLIIFGMILFGVLIIVLKSIHG